MMVCVCVFLTTAAFFRFLELHRLPLFSRQGFLLQDIHLAERRMSRCSLTPPPSAGAPERSEMLRCHHFRRLLLHLSQPSAPPQPPLRSGRSLKWNSSINLTYFVFFQRLSCVSHKKQLDVYCDEERDSVQCQCFEHLPVHKSAFQQNIKGKQTNSFQPSLLLITNGLLQRLWENHELPGRCEPVLAVIFTAAGL